MKTKRTAAGNIVALLHLPRLGTSGVNHNCENGVLGEGSQEQVLVLQIEICGCSAKEI